MSNFQSYFGHRLKSQCAGSLSPVGILASSSVISQQRTPCPLTCGAGHAVSSISSTLTTTPSGTSLGNQPPDQT